MFSKTKIVNDGKINQKDLDNYKMRNPKIPVIDMPREQYLKFKKLKDE